MKAFILGLSAMLMNSISIAGDSDLARWEACVSKIKASTPKALQGVDGGGMTDAINRKCGRRPMDAEACRNIYAALKECPQFSPSCATPVDDLSNVSRSWVRALDKRTTTEFERACVKACETKATPDFKSFSGKFCR